MCASMAYIHSATAEIRRRKKVDVTDTTVVYTTVVYVLHTTAARWRHTPTKLLPLTSPNPNPNPNPNKSD